MKMEKVLTAAGAFSGFLAVSAGAFGAHVLGPRLSAHMMEVFETGVRYQMYHGLALLVTGMTFAQSLGKAVRFARWMFIAGILLFSGSLYLLAFTEMRLLGAVTPIGGVAFLLGWLSLAWGALAGGRGGSV
jgi:uncharacterized membrane protein YgdD (TMEM256/DUF423 family)